jgi:hypothetical protein
LIDPPLIRVAQELPPQTRPCPASREIAYSIFAPPRPTSGWTRTPTNASAQARRYLVRRGSSAHCYNGRSLEWSTSLFDLLDVKVRSARRQSASAPRPCRATRARPLQNLPWWRHRRSKQLTSAELQDLTLCSQALPIALSTPTGRYGGVVAVCSGCNMHLRQDPSGRCASLSCRTRQRMRATTQAGPKWLNPQC